MLTFLVVSSGGGAGNPGESSGASQPHTSSLRLSHPERAGAAEPAVPLLTRPGALAWAETSPRAQSAFSHLLCLVGLKGNRSSSQVEQQSRASCIQDACRYEQSKLHRILVLWYRVCARVCACACAHFCFLRWVSLRNIARRWWGRDLSTVWFLLSYDTHIHSWTHIHRLKYVSTRQGFFCKNVFITPNKSSKITEWKT